MDKSIEAMKLALEALEVATTPLAKDRQKVLRAITAIKEALAQTQEPVANDPLPRACNLAGVDYQTFLKIKAYMPVAPPQRTWVGLDHQDKKKFSSWLDHKTDEEVFTAIDDLLREMNT